MLVTYGINTVGGVQHWQHLFAHNLLKMGHQVTILEVYDYSQLQPDKAFLRTWDPGIKIIRNFGHIIQRGVNKNTFFAAIKVLIDFKTKQRFHELVMEEKYHSILFTDPNFTFYFFTKTLSANNCIVQFHSSFHRFKTTSRIRYWLVKRRLRFYQKFIFLSFGDCCQAKDEGFLSEKVDYMYNFIDEKKFGLSRQTVDKRKKQILFVGNLDNPDKQVDHLIKAFALVDENIRLGWKVVIVGDGETKQALIKLADNLLVSDHVLFVGKE